MTTTTLLTVEEVADRLKCHPQTVRRWIWSGELGHVKVGGLVRIPEEEVHRLLGDGKQGAKRGKKPVGVAALRATMHAFRTRISGEDMADLTEQLVDGEQPAEWGSPIE